MSDFVLKPGSPNGYYSLTLSKSDWADLINALEITASESGLTHIQDMENELRKSAETHNIL